MITRTLTIEDATPESIAPYGVYVGAQPGVPVYAAWSGVTIYGALPAEIGSGGELLHVRMEARAFPAQLALMERHFKHAQTYLSANGKPYVMVLGTETENGLPQFSSLRAFLFREASGIALHPGTWHEFPLALEDDTRFTVMTRHEAHQNDLTDRAYPMDARGPDLERFEIRHLAEIIIPRP